MKTYLLLLFAFVVFAGELRAQSFQKGTNVIALGVAFGHAYSEYTYDIQSPGLGVQYEKGIWEAGPGVISLGGYLGTKTYRNSTFGERWNYTMLGFRSAYHYNRFTKEQLKKLDPYAGIMVAYSMLGSRTNPNTGGGRYRSRFDNGFFAGARYYFKNNLAGFAEIGLGVSSLTVGGALKF